MPASFGSPSALASQPLGEVLRTWQGLGYPRRAARLHQCARLLVDTYAGRVPGDLDSLLALQDPRLDEALRHADRDSVLEQDPEAFLSRVEKLLADRKIRVVQ